VTLAMACMIAAAWIRSMVGQSSIAIRTEKRACVGIKSVNQVISVYYFRFDDPSMMWDGMDTVEFSNYLFTEQPGLKNWPGRYYRWRFWLFDWRDFSKGPHHRDAGIIFPHRLIAVPLTILSAYLIIWPGKRNPNHARSGQSPNP